MDSTNIASIWTANTGWELSTLQDVMCPQYSDDGDFLGSDFSRSFSLGFVDDDKVEANQFELTNSLTNAMEGFSYDLEIVSDMATKMLTPIAEPIDTLVVIYDYSFSGAPGSSTIRNKIFVYRGSFEY